ncbi:DUF882 domain-containing protein [Ahrensia sp. R2A130]|uniref:DUF882 domain-containing protein n=1 Tax=Ahrensia sp. R2A130 TaxID=744979 RepID=UPI0001E0ACA3|nr:DUF882 domain-containing protein [Ahrensia sp. R2A130]EFL88658.1 ATP/GTP-binding site motif A [Ahrensia sp. R2A130]
MSRFLAFPLAFIPAMALALVVLTGWTAAFTTQASAETRTLKMYFTHTRESATITFKKNGKYIPSGLRQANRFLRDWRRKEPTKMDPALLDLVWEVYQKSGGRKGIHVISAYRSPRTNKMLRRRGRNVAKTSQHTRGKAMDFAIPGVSVNKIRALGLKAHRGGVGFYRGAFVHLDTGRVRHWPRMNRRQLAKVFPRGKTIHVPSNGKPLKGYKVAAANLKKGRNADGSRRKTTVSRSLLARIFAPGPDGDEDEGAADVKPVKKAPAAKPKPKPAPVAVASARPPALSPNAAANDPFAKRPAPTPAAKPVEAVALANSEAESTAQRAAAALAEGTVADPQPETITLASMEPARIAVPRFSPRAAIPAPQPQPETVVAALTPQNGTSVLERARSETYGTPTGLAAGLRPRADIPNGVATTAPAQPEPLIRTASLPPQLAPATVPLPTAVETPVTLPSTALRQPIAAPEDVAALKERITATLSRGGPSATIARAAKIQKEALAKPQQIASLADRTADSLSRPSARPVSQPDAITTPRQAQRPIPLPAKPKVGTRDITRVAGGAPTEAELALGNLDGYDVKVWAVAASTRVGPVATLKAPNYRKGPRRILPAAVYTAGFSSGKRVPRDTGFKGGVLTRVAFADINR